MQPSNTRRKPAFVPWLAALVIGATAHAGWLLHGLDGHAHCDEHGAGSPPVIVNVAAPPASIEAPQATQRRARARGPRPRCRHTSAPPAFDERDELDLWIHQTGRHSYTIDRRVLDHVAFADVDLQHIGADALGVVASLRNVRRGTPLYVLGLRTGDRVRAIATSGEPMLEQVEVTLERRGQLIVLHYQIV